MASEKEVRNGYNMIIGWVRDYGDRLVATHIRKGYVGSYTKSSNITIDASGRIYCYGDGCQDLIRSADRG
mgnify:CR=1 FL=1